MECVDTSSWCGRMSYHFGVTVTMSSGFSSRIIMSRAYTPVLFEVAK